MCLATLIATQVRATEPLAFKPASGVDFATILTVSGTIQQIGKQSAVDPTQLPKELASDKWPPAS
jgi:hypothetical protein